jgi:release factor glutamine methyltransferase
MKTVKECLDWAKQTLAIHDNPDLESQLLLGHILQKERAWLYTWPEIAVTAAQASAFEEIVNQRKQGMPIAYILGYKEFWSHNFKVSEHTLIPRPETELLIETLLTHLPTDLQCVVDVGTGSGIIACTLALARPTWQLIATDTSANALEIAKENAKNLQCTNIEFRQTEWLMGFEGMQCDAIVSNPPYIKANDPHLIEGDLPFEPKEALVPGETGLEAFEILIQQSKGCLKPKGLLAFEHGFDQSQALTQLFTKAGFVEINTLSDLAGIARVTFATFCP